MVLREENEQGILVGFEFAILDRRLSESKRACTKFSQAPEHRGATGEGLISGQGFDDVATHHVATLALSRCKDDPPVHQFQHELESFVWSILFIQSGFRCGRRVLSSDLEKWYVGDWGSIETAKQRFVKMTGSNASNSAGQFAKSLGVDPQPLMACSQSLAMMLLNSESKQLDAALILSALQGARDAYAKDGPRLLVSIAHGAPHPPVFDAAC